MAVIIWRILPLCLCLFLNEIHGRTEHARLNMTHDRHSGVAVLANYANGINVSYTHWAWNIDPNTQRGYDLLLAMSNEWTFHPLIESQLTFTFNGFTPNRTVDDGEFMLVFSVNNTQFFSVVIRLDTQRNTWKYYPQINAANNATSFASTTAVYEDIIRGSSNGTTEVPMRWDRVSGNGAWTDIPSLTQAFYREKLVWPFTVKLINNPQDDTLLYQCNLSRSGATLQVEYESAFVGGESVDVYLLNDANDNKPFYIYSIEAEYYDNRATLQVAYESAFVGGESVDVYLLNDANDNKPFYIYSIEAEYYDNESIPDIQTTEELGDLNTTEMLDLSTTEIDIMANITETETMDSTEMTETASTETSETSDNMQTSSDEQNIEQGPDSTLSGGAIAGIVIGCFCFVLLLVLGGWYLLKLKDKKANDPSGVNKGEYMRPDVEVTPIDDVLAQKRKESYRLSAGAATT
eukprot:CAMPEP_0197077328 /NCGR_PEP_ID=MMETSP1384-20130603/212565_1 /TAXON_ID=29189 /ORGANISM="Ammonia sp." /LENGTH=462 /DNA_ID=CAMNT_0042516191 /DNA_START=19 /DNA_END=1405 /DNA_ORIENTATION=+